MPSPKPEEKSRKKTKTPDAAQLSLHLPPDLLGALDAWIASQPSKVGRQEAIRAFIVSGLGFMGGGAAPLARLASLDQHRKPDAHPMAPHISRVLPPQDAKSPKSPKSLRASSGR